MMMTTILALLVVFALGWYAGHRWTQASMLFDRMIADALDRDPQRPSWLLDESEV